MLVDRSFFRLKGTPSALPGPVPDNLILGSAAALGVLSLIRLSALSLSVPLVWSRTHSPGLVPTGEPTTAASRRL
jgi:hypothetical protein